MRLLRSLALATAALVLALSARADEVVSPFAKWEKEISAFEAKDREAAPPKGGIVFIGSSSIRLWKTLAEDFPHHRVLNRGFGGSEMADSAHFADRIVLPYEPRFVVVYAGGNDINKKKTAEQVLAAFQDFEAKVHAKLPQTTIAYISIAGNPKRWSQVDEVRKANAMIEAFTKTKPHLKFINVFDSMMGADGLPLPHIFVADQLHMNAEGYKIWTKVVGQHLPPADVK